MKKILLLTFSAITQCNNLQPIPVWSPEAVSVVQSIIYAYGLTLYPIPTIHKQNNILNKRNLKFIKYKQHQRNMDTNNQVRKQKTFSRKDTR